MRASARAAHARPRPVAAPAGVAVAALTAIGGAVRFLGLDRESFWVDETITAQLVDGPLVDMLRTIPRAESTPPLYYVLAWLWSRVAGADEAGLRSLSALAGTAAIPVCYAAGRALVSQRTGVIVAALAAASPLLVWYSQEARAYSLFVLLGALSLLFFARAWATPSRRDLVLWAVACALTMATHYFGVFLAGAEGALLLYRHRDRTAWIAAGAVVAAGLALLPLAAYQATHASSGWLRLVDLSERMEDTVRQLLVPSAPTIWAGAGVPADQTGSWWLLGVVVLSGAVAAVGVLGTRCERRGALVALAVGSSVVAVPVLLSLAAAVVTDGRGDVYLYRNVVVAWLPLTIVVGAALGMRRAGVVGALAASALAAWSLAAVAHNASTPRLQRDDWRLVARALGPPDGQVVILSPSWQIAALEYHVPGVRELGPGALADEIAVLVRTHVPSYSPAVERVRPPRGFERVDTRELQNWVLTTFRAPTRRYVRPSEIPVAPVGASYVPVVRSG